MQYLNTIESQMVLLSYNKIYSSNVIIITLLVNIIFFKVSKLVFYLNKVRGIENV